MTISDRIRKQMEQPDGLTSEALAPLAEAYGNETSQVNLRLAESLQLLRKGLRSEAIQRAFMKPNVLDWSSQLDFPELEEWLSILQFYGIASPMMLDLNAAQQLQEAIVEEQPLEELLKQHRRLAIAKAPLAWRLKVLRRLGTIDSMNPVWREDQKQWEAVRLKQIPLELNAAIEVESLTAVQDISTELNKSEWELKPAADLCNRAAGAARKLIFQDQVLQLRAIADQLHAAYLEGNEEAASREHQSWLTIAKTLASPMPAELSQSVEPAVEWLQETTSDRARVEKHESASAMLESMLQKETPLAELQRGYFDVTALQLGIDPILDSRYQSRISELKQTARRKLQLSFFGISVTAVTALVILGLWQWQRTHQIAVSDASKKLSALLESESLDESQKLVDRIRTQAPSVANSPELVSLASKLESMVDAERLRSDRVARLIADATEDDPTKIDIDKLMLAEKEAVTGVEKDNLRKIRNAWEKNQRQIGEGQFAAVKESLDRINAKASEIQKLSLSEIDDRMMDAMLVDLKQLMVDNPKSGAQAKNLADLSTQRIKSLRDSILKQRRQLEQRQVSMTGIRDSKTPAAFEVAVQRYISSLPGDSLAGEFSEAMKEVAHWKTVEAWNTWCKEVEPKLSNGLSPEESKFIETALSGFQASLIGNPGAKWLSEVTELTGLVANRTSSLETLSGELVNSIIGDLVTVVVPKGDSILGSERQFLSYQSRVENAAELATLGSGSKISLPIISDALGAVSQERFTGKLVVLDDPRSAIRKIVTRIESSRPLLVEDWEGQMIAMVNEVASNQNLDHLVKGILLSRILKASAEGSPAMRDSMAALRSSLAESAEERNFWFLKGPLKTSLDPDVLKILQKCSQDVKTQRDASLAAIGQIARNRYVWVGAMLRDTNDKIEPWCYRSDVPNGLLCTVIPSAGASSAGEVVPVGYVQDKQVKLDAPPESLLPGRPLYWMRTSNTVSNR